MRYPDRSTSAQLETVPTKRERIYRGAQVPIYYNRTMSPRTYGLGRALEDAIVRIGEPSVPKFIETLADERWLIYSTSFDLLKRIGTPEAMKAIEGFEGR